ncbi:MAG: hypothetical protein ACOCXT_06285 [Candidatus Dojkabacteria bacterium]
MYISSPTIGILRKYKEMFPSHELNILLTYAYRGSNFETLAIDLKKEGVTNKIILDSGAYTLNKASSQNLKTTFNGFKRFCKDHCEDFEYIFNYDEDFNSDGFYTNNEKQIELDELCHKIVPVVHDYKEEYGEVDHYINNKYPIISLGYHSKNKNEANITKLTKKIHNSGLKVHLLGVSDYKIVKKSGVDLNDSSNWAQASTYGYIYLFVQGKEDLEVATIRFRDYIRNPKDDTMLQYSELSNKDEIESFIYDTFNFTYRDLMGLNRDINRQIINVYYFVQMQDIIRKYKKEHAAKNNSASQSSSSTSLVTAPPSSSDPTP